MKIIVMSDSHSDKETVKIVSSVEGEAYFHCGDSELAYDDPVLHSTYKVRGNCDFNPGFPSEVVATVGEKTILMVHGHQHDVKSSLQGLYEAAKIHNADIVLFGHSHLYGAEMKEGILFVNPGSTILPRGGKAPTYATIEWDERFKIEFKDMKHQVIDSVVVTNE